MSWDNSTSPGLRTVWHQIDWGAVLGLPPTSGLLQDALVGPPGTRIPVSNTSGLNPVAGWPQPITTAQWSLMLHAAVSGHPEPDPLGFPDPGAQWAVTNQLSLAGLASVCSIGVPIVIDAGSTGVSDDLSDFDFGDRMSVSTSITILD